MKEIILKVPEDTNFITIVRAHIIQGKSELISQSFEIKKETNEIISNYDYE